MSDFRLVLCTCPVDNAAELGRFDELVDPGCPIPADAMRVHGITGAMVRGAPSVAEVLPQARIIHLLRDPTRGGVSGVCSEIAQDSNLGILLRENALPLDKQVAAACEILGLDPLYVANEGIFCAVVKASASAAVLDFMKKHPKGSMAALIGELREAHPGKVVMESPVGGTRIVTPLIGEQLPRIC